METLVRAAPNGAFSSIIKDRGRDGWRRRWLLTMVSSAALAVAGTQIAAAQEASDEEAQAAISQFNDYQLGGRNLTVNEARPKTGGGGGGFGGGDNGRRRRSEPRW